MYLQGKHAHESGNFEIAAQLFDQLVKKEPRNAVLQFALATSLMKLKKFEPAMKHLEKAAKLKPMMPEIHATMGAIERTCLNEDAAIKHYQRAMAIRKDFPPAIYGLTDLYRKLGRFDDAVDLITKALERSPSADPHLAEAFAVIAKDAGREQDAIDHIRKVLETDVPITTRSSLNFRLAGLLDSIKEHNQAWETVVLANDQKVTRWDPVAYETDVEDAIKYWTRERVEQAPSSGSDSEVPVFVVGMPRSGTSLVEQIIASHPAGAGAGEINALPIAACRQQGIRYHNGMVFLRDISKITSQSLSRECDEYLASARRISSQVGDEAGAERIVDKLPYNYQILPLIQMMFPKARVIHTVRDPRDTCISCFFQDFLGELGYSYNLKHLAAYYAQHERIMEHMKKVLDIPVLEVRYEQLVEEPEPGIRAILDHIGLEFHEDSVRFYESKRAVHTASLEQVRKPMYKTSSARWKRYGELIEPLTVALAGAGVSLPTED
ncbi:MAG: tetratricopeptide repeat protein [Phycisphaerales bacterium]